MDLCLEPSGVETTCPTGAGLRMALVTDTAALEKLRPEWERLLHSSASPEPMLSPDWLLTWWRIYGQHRALCAAVFKDGNDVVAVAPLLRRRYWYRPGIPFRRIEFIGADVDEQDGVCSEYLNVITRAGAEAAVANALVENLVAGALGPWDELTLGAMDGLGRMPDPLAEAARRAGLSVERMTTTHAPYIPLPSTWEEYLAPLPKKKRYGIVRALRDFETWNGGPIVLQRVRNLADLARGKEILARLHQERWQAAGAHGAFGSARFAAFHDVLMPKLLAEGKLEVSWLSVRDEPVACIYSIIANGKTYFYQCGRRMDVPQGQRPGIVLIALSIQEAIRSGRREFDFLGGVSMYKSQMATALRPVVSLRIVRPCLREKLRRGADWALQGVRRARGVLGRRNSPDKPVKDL